MWSDHKQLEKHEATIVRLGIILCKSVRDVTLFFSVMKPHELAKIHYGEDFRNFWTLEPLTEE